MRHPLCCHLFLCCNGVRHRSALRLPAFFRLQTLLPPSRKRSLTLPVSLYHSSLYLTLYQVSGFPCWWILRWCLMSPHLCPDLRSLNSAHSCRLHNPQDFSVTCPVHRIILLIRLLTCCLHPACHQSYHPEKKNPRSSWKSCFQHLPRSSLPYPAWNLLHRQSLRNLPEVPDHRWNQNLSHSDFLWFPAMHSR